jgi:hypothetical protein
MIPDRAPKRSRANEQPRIGPQPTYTVLCETLHTSPVVIPDETGWKVRGLLHWLWVFATATTTVRAASGVTT